MQSKEPVRVQSICSVVLLWVQLGETIAQDFDPAIWKSPTLRNINDLNDSLLRIWKVAMDRTSELVYKIIPQTSPDVAVVLEKEYQSCRQETWTLFQVTPETLEDYVDALKIYTSNTSLWHLDERKFLNTDATLVKSLSQLNLAVS
uniref:Putative secreted protein n=2 Tax=Ixodes scapularis TaxID=6945 RepID=A0A4D5RU32_IXOSC